MPKERTIKTYWSDYDKRVSKLTMVMGKIEKLVEKNDLCIADRIFIYQILKDVEVRRFFLKDPKPEHKLPI